MPALLASHFLAGSILTLALPLGVAIVILGWYWIVWRRGSEERVKGRQAAGDRPGRPPGAGDHPPAA